MKMMKAGKWPIALAMSATTLLASLTPPSFGTYAMAFSAEQHQPSISKEEAIQRAQKWVAIPEDYKLEDATYMDDRREDYYGQPVWDLNWQNNQGDGYISVTIDALSGELSNFSRYGKAWENKGGGVPVTAEQAIESATAFLQRVAPKEEVAKLSKPNEFGGLSNYYPHQIDEHVVEFTRVENGIPFLENGFRIVVGANGQIFNYSREWFEGELPASDGAIAPKKAEEALADKSSPSLVYTRKDRLINDYQSGNRQYMLVYRYSETDPQILDAFKGVILNQLGEPAESSTKVQALGTTVRSTTGKMVTKEEAQIIADEIVKKLPGTYRSDGSHGGGTSTGADGVRSEHWDFEYLPLDSPEKKPEPVVLQINDRGELLEYSTTERGYIGERGEKIEQAIPWTQAEKKAVELVKRLFADRLGEIYLMNQQPSPEKINEWLEQGRSYTVMFGWLKGGIPIEEADFEVTVNPKTGQVERLDMFRSERYEALEQSGKTFDVETAKKVEREHKKMLLTYYLPRNTRFEPSFAQKKPQLVYRYVGDNGVVDAVSGEWLSFSKLREKKTPQDIADHPAKEALLFAIDRGLLSVNDGKVEPEKLVTRAEMAMMMSRMTNRIEFHRRLLANFDREEDSKPYNFADVDEKHPMYAAIQNCVQSGLIAKEGTRRKCSLSNS